MPPAGGQLKRLPYVTRQPSEEYSLPGGAGVLEDHIEPINHVLGHHLPVEERAGKHGDS